MAATGGSTKEAKPTLGGTKFKTRKRDEKVKLDVTSFSEQLIAGLRESGGNLDEVRRFLDNSGGQLDYRSASPAPRLSVGPSLTLTGGTGSRYWTFWLPEGCWPLEEGRWRGPPYLRCRCSNASQWWRPFVATLWCVSGLWLPSRTLFLLCYVQVMTKLLQRYKYLKKGLEDEMKKILKFLKGFQDSERRSLAIYTGLLLSEVLVPASVLTSLLRYIIVHAVLFGGVLRCGSCSEVLVKEGMSLQFVTLVFQTWLSEKNISHVGSALRKAQLEARLTVSNPLLCGSSGLSH